MKPVLIVDDDPLNLEILRESLEGEPYVLTEAGDGEQALGLLTQADANFDCVVLDHKMPRMDGLELVRRIKGDGRWRQVPLIMQTAVAEPTEIARGLDLGIFCYLTKPCDPRILRAAVRSALVQREEWRVDSGDSAQRSSISRLMTQGSFELRTFEEARNLAASIANLAHDPPAVSLGLNELLANAIEHGNLMIGYRDKSRLLESGTWLEEIARRHLDPKLGERKVRVGLTCGNDIVTVRIADEGTGFDSVPYLSIAPERAFHLHGRGIIMARQLSFRKLEYHGNGNTVEVAFGRGS